MQRVHLTMYLQRAVPSMSWNLCDGWWTSVEGIGLFSYPVGHTNTPYGLADLIVGERLTHTPDRLFRFPGTEVERDALGTLHANCGNCHNDSRDRVPSTDLNLWVNVEDDTVSATGAWKTAVGQPNRTFADQHVTGQSSRENPMKRRSISNGTARK